MSTTKRGTWDQLRLAPSELMRRVIAGTATIVGKDKHGRKIYQLHQKSK